MNLPNLAIIVPCFNEEDCIKSTSQRLLSVIKDLEEKQEISPSSFIFFIDDGSNDKTWDYIKDENKNNPEKIKGIKFSKNFGNQKAILAGLLETKKLNADCVITIDADLQQDEYKIIEFVQKYKQGASIVLGIRNDRKTDGILKKSSSTLFYKFMNILGVNITQNHSEYRLLSKEVINAFSEFKETNLFLRGIFNDIGFKKDYVYFDVKKREKGKSKFTPFKLFTLALNGITSFSIIPLRMVTLIGFMVFIISICIGVSALIDKIVYDEIVSGWTTIVVATSFIGGLQILCIGIIGEYLGQLFQEVKKRPRYIIEEAIE